MFKTTQEYKKDLDNLLKMELNASQKSFIDYLYVMCTDASEEKHIIYYDKYYGIWFDYMKNLYDFGYISNLEYDLCVDLIQHMYLRTKKVV